MGIIKRMIKSQENFYSVNKFYDLFCPNEMNRQIIDFNESNKNSLKKIIEKSLKIGKTPFHMNEIQYYYTFSIDGDECVFLFSNNSCFDLKKYPIIKKWFIGKFKNRFHYNTETDFTIIYDENSEVFFQYKGDGQLNDQSVLFDKEMKKLEYDSLFDEHYLSLLCCIRVVSSNRTDGSLTDVLFYSFEDVEVEKCLDKKKELFYKSLYFNVDDYQEKMDKILFFNSIDEKVSIQNIRIVKNENHKWIKNEKLSELVYKIKGYHVRTSGSNNWNEDTTTEGIFNFLENKWESFDEKVENFKL